MKQFLPALIILTGVLSNPLFVQADGTVIDRVYHPYVQPLERELEVRFIEERNNNENRQLYRLGYGQSLNDRWFVEMYVVGENQDNNSFDVTAVELEAKWQLTEQGEYWADFGLLFELEKYLDENIWEQSTTLLVEKEWGKWSTTANFSLNYEWGDDIENEYETVLALQARYRWKMMLEPGVELYSGQDSKGVGPVLLGQINVGVAKKLKWEAGVIFALENESPDQTVRFSLEYEF